MSDISKDGGRKFAFDLKFHRDFVFVFVFLIFIILYVNCFGRTVLYMCIEYHI